NRDDAAANADDECSEGNERWSKWVNPPPKWKTKASLLVTLGRERPIGPRMVSLTRSVSTIAWDMWRPMSATVLIRPIGPTPYVATAPRVSGVSLMWVSQSTVDRRVVPP